MAPRSPGPDLDDTRARKSDQDHMRAQAAKADQHRADAYDAGRKDAKAGHPRGHSEPFEPDLGEYYHAGYDDGQAAKPKPKPEPSGSDSADDEPLAAGYPTSSSSASSSSSPAKSGPGWFNPSLPKTEVSQQGASVLLGLFAYALVLNYLRYGWAGDTAWFKAKFLNKVTVAPSSGTAGSGPVVLVPNAGLTPGGAPTGGPAPQAGGVIA